MDVRFFCSFTTRSGAVGRPVVVVLYHRCVLSVRPVTAIVNGSPLRAPSTAAELEECNTRHADSLRTAFSVLVGAIVYGYDSFSVKCDSTTKQVAAINSDLSAWSHY